MNLRKDHYHNYWFTFCEHNNVCAAHHMPHLETTTIYPQFYFTLKTKITTSNNGYLGSRIDEDRSEFRYIMRIAGFVNHQIVERILHFFTREVSLFECVLKSLESSGFQLVGRYSLRAKFPKEYNTQCKSYHVPLWECESMVPSKRNFEAHNSFQWYMRMIINTNHTSNQRRLPAGLKHLIKPRKRN